jgi:hypothetical protein
MSALTIYLIPAFLFGIIQLYTIWHIWSGEFPGRWEKRRLLQSTFNLPLIGLWQYWTSSVHRRNRHNGYMA